MSKPFNYDDIIDLPHHVSKKHPQMKISDRAAQFAPFAALTGYDGAVKETARLTDEKIELSESALEMLNMKLQMVCDNLNDAPEVSITYFVPDKKKTGGSYFTRSGCVRRIDDFEHKVILTDGSEIEIDMISEIEGDLFSCLEEY